MNGALYGKRDLRVSWANNENIQPIKKRLGAGLENPKN